MSSKKFLQLKNKGNDFYRNGRYNEAIAVYKECIDLCPENAIAHANRAMCFLKLQKFIECELDCTQCLKFDSNFIKAYLRRGIARKELKKYKLALQDFVKVLQLQPTNIQAFAEKSILLKLMKESKNNTNQTSKPKRKHPQKKVRTKQTIIRKITKNVQNIPASSSLNTENINKNKIFFGQLVIGPPGSGKSTYCQRIAQFMHNVLERKVVLINLDPNIDINPDAFHASIDINELISVTDVAQHLNLGPNGALVYCMQYLSENLEWLRKRLNAIADDCYLIFDCPGQIELYCHHSFMRHITHTMYHEWHYNITCVNLVDIYHCFSVGQNINNYNYISIVLMSLSMMLHLELPHVNIFSKCDLIKYYTNGSSENTTLDEFCNTGEFLYQRKARAVSTVIDDRLQAMGEKIAECVSDFGLVSFLKFSIFNFAMICEVCQVIDKSNGYDLIAEYFTQMKMKQKFIDNENLEIETNDDINEMVHDPIFDVHCYLKNVNNDNKTETNDSSFNVPNISERIF